MSTINYAGENTITKVMELTKGALAEQDNVLIVIPGTTTYAEVLAAFNANKAIVTKYNNHYYYFSFKGNTDNTFYFQYNTGEYYYVITLNSSGNWNYSYDSGRSEEIANKVTTTLAAADKTYTKYPSVKAITDYIDDMFGAHLLWTGSETAKDVKARNSEGNWNIENLDMTPYKYVILYVQACSGSNADQEGSSFAVRIDLQTDLLSPRSNYYIGSSIGFYANDNGAKYGVVFTIDSTKTKVCFNYCDANTTGTTALGRDGKLVRIEGFKN